MLDSAITGLVLPLQWPAIGYLGLGVLLGLYFGAVPGLSGLTGMAILMPFTFGMDPVAAFAFLIGMYAVTTTSDTIPAVLIGVPGTAAAAATVLDGYPMAKRGEAARAFGAAFTSSAVGGVIGAVCMGLSIPIVRPLVLSFAKPEFFMVGILCLTLVGSLSGKSVLKGLVAAGLGLLIAMVGYAQQVAIPRYWMGIPYLLDGFRLVPLVLGLFAVSEVLSLALSNQSISQVPQEQTRSGLLAGVRDACEHWWLLLRSSMLGVYIGILPVLGPTVADWVAYGHAVQSAKDKSTFGKGDVRGVIAPEAANNSVKGGDLVPTVAFGIPGSAGMAILLGAFLIQGLTPGPQMLTEKLHITFSMMWTLVIANVVAAALLMLWTKQLTRIIFIQGHLIVPAITLFIFMGAWESGGQIGDWITMQVFGAVGHAMKEAGWPRTPLMLGFILEPIMENALHLSLRAYGLTFIWRPICLVLAAATLLTLLYVIWTNSQRRRDDATPQALDTDLANPAVSLPLAAVVVALFAYAPLAALQWPPSVRLFPLAIGLPALALALAALARDVLAVRRARATRAAEVPAAPKPAPGSAGLVPSLKFFAWLAAVPAASVLVGQLAALTLFVALYLVAWGKVRWRTAAIYAAACLLFLYVVFDKLVHTMWYPSLLFG